MTVAAEHPGHGGSPALCVRNTFVEIKETTELGHLNRFLSDTPDAQVNRSKKKEAIEDMLPSFPLICGDAGTAPLKQEKLGGMEEQGIAIKSAAASISACGHTLPNGTQEGRTQVAPPPGSPPQSQLGLFKSDAPDAQVNHSVQSGMEEQVDTIKCATGFTSACKSAFTRTAEGETRAILPLEQPTHAKPGLFQHRSENCGNRICFTVDAAKLKSKERSITSPRFCIDLDHATAVRFIIKIKSASGRSFKNSGGMGTVEFSCLHPFSTESHGSVLYRFGIASSRNQWHPGELHVHDFAQHCTSQEEELSFSELVNGNVFCVVLEVNPHTPEERQLDATTSIKQVPMSSVEFPTCSDGRSANRTETLQEHFIAIDVECVATGTSHSDRALGSVAIVDENLQTIFFEHIKPSVPVRSCLTPLTGIKPEHLENARGAAEVVSDVKRKMDPLVTVIVGQSVGYDVKHLGLQEGVHFKRIEDTAQIFRLPNPKCTSGFQFFSLRHICKHLLGVDPQPDTHSPVQDALCAMRLINRYGRGRCSEDQLQSLREALAQAPPTPSFASQLPFIDGCQVSGSSSRSLGAVTSYDLDTQVQRNTIDMSTCPMSTGIPTSEIAARAGPFWVGGLCSIPIPAIPCIMCIPPDNQLLEATAQLLACKSLKQPTGIKPEHYCLTHPSYGCLQNWTNLCIRNIPLNMSRNRFLRFVEERGFTNIDFVYVPHDFNNSCGKGYGFANLPTTAAALKVFDLLNGFDNWQDEGFSSKKTVLVCWAEKQMQGREKLVEYFRNNSVMHHTVKLGNPEFQPLLIENGQPVEFPPPTKRLRPPKVINESDKQTSRSKAS